MIVLPVELVTRLSETPNPAARYGWMSMVCAMNFELIPELKWRYGYFVFWGFVLAFSLGMLGLMKRNRWL